MLSSVEGAILSDDVKIREERIFVFNSKFCFLDKGNVNIIVFQKDVQFTAFRINRVAVPLQDFHSVFAIAFNDAAWLVMGRFISSNSVQLYLSVHAWLASPMFSVVVLD